MTSSSAGSGSTSGSSSWRAAAASAAATSTGVRRRTMKVVRFRRGGGGGAGGRVRIPEIGLRPVALRLYMFHMNRGLRRSALAHHHLPFFNHSLARLEGRDGRVARGLYL